MSIRRRPGLHPLGRWFVALALASLIGVGARLPPDASAATQQRAMAQLSAICDGARRVAPKPLHPAPPAWFRLPAVNLASAVAMPLDGPAPPAPRAAMALADGGHACSPVDAGRVPEAALPRGPPDQAHA